MGNPAASKPRSGAHSRIGGLRGAVFVYFLRGPRGPQADLELAHVAEVGLEPLVHLPAPSQILEIRSLRHRVDLMSRLWLPPKMMFGRLCGFGAAAVWPAFKIEIDKMSRIVLACLEARGQEYLRAMGIQG